MLRRWTTAWLAAVLLLSVPAGCNYEQLAQQSDTDYGSRQPGDPKMMGAKAYGPNTGNPDQHHNGFFEYSSMLSRRVNALNGIAGSIVMLTDKNAYVAILLDWTAVGTTNKRGTEEQNNTGTTDGVYNADNGSPFGNPRRVVSPYNSYFTVEDHNNLSPELKQTIASRIREYVPSVQEVHISANMELVNYFNEFAKEAWAGRSLLPWVQQFNTVVQFHFDGGAVRPEAISQPAEPNPRRPEHLN
ncbi:hypothetical protein [Paenibacillus chungangensis]|uniref:Sporulation protein n=1 Tax=Paenibacillus chungangensis TaxID=696535 RepID=A0ABW3HX30_9BACL